MTEKKTDMPALPSACPEGSSSSKAHFGNWGIYAAAAGATLAMSTNAEAVIVYTTLGQSVSLPAYPLTSSELSHGKSVAQKTFPLSIQGHKGTGTLYLRRSSAHNLAAAKIIGNLALATSGGLTSSGGHAAKDFLANQIIGASRHFSGHGATFLDKHTSLGATKGFFEGNKTGFVGFSNGVGNLGWLEIMVSSAGTPGYTNELKVIAYAYNTVADSPIEAGQGIPTSTPEPDTAALGLLASGAAGLAIWRRRRKEIDAV